VIADRLQKPADAVVELPLPRAVSRPCVAVSPLYGPSQGRQNGPEPPSISLSLKADRL